MSKQTEPVWTLEAVIASEESEIATWQRLHDEDERQEWKEHYAHRILQTRRTIAALRALQQKERS